MTGRTYNKFTLYLSLPHQHGIKETRFEATTGNTKETSGTEGQG